MANLCTPLHGALFHPALPRLPEPVCAVCPIMCPWWCSASEIKRSEAALSVRSVADIHIPPALWRTMQLLKTLIVAQAKDATETV